MKLLQILIACLMLILSAFFSSVFAESNDVAIDYLSLNEDISLIKKKSEKIELAFNEEFSVAINTLLGNKITQVEHDKANNINLLEVVATAYTSHVAQTDSTPTIAAWGDHLKPNTRAIAVSRDLLTEYGLKHRSKVRITGLEGEFLVLDKMHKRWQKKIDIYMGMNRKAAFKWGTRKVVLSWYKEAV